MERCLGDHLTALVEVFREVRRVIKPKAAVWLNYGDCYATAPNGRSAADTKAAGNDDRTFRDKPFSTIGPIYEAREPGNRRGKKSTLGGSPPADTPGRVTAGGFLKPKDLCLIPFRLAIALQEDGWWVRSRCIWGKPNGMPDSSGRYRPSVAHEEIFLLSKSGDIEYDFEAVKAPLAEASVQRLSQDVASQTGSTRANAGRKTNGNMKAVGGKQAAHGRRHAGFNECWDTAEAASESPDGRLLRTYEPDVWHIATAAYTEAHFATFPPALVERCLMASCPKGATVLDPFGGAGTTALVADRMGRHAILCELNPEYAALARKRIESDSPLFAEVA